MNDKIGLRIQDVKIGDKVYFYPYVSHDGSHPDGVETEVLSLPFQSNCGSIVCFLEGISGYVLLSHIAKEFYEELQVKIKPSSKRYMAYTQADIYDSFHQFLGIIKPIVEMHYVTGNHRYVSRKYPSVKSDYFKYKKDAKADYKIKLKEYKLKNKIR